MAIIDSEFGVWGRYVHGERDSDKKRFISLYRPDFEDRQDGYNVEIEFAHDNGDEDFITLTAEERDILIEALQAWAEDDE